MHRSTGIGEEFSGYAEEVLRLTGHLTAGRELPSAVMRNILANRMAFTLGVHFRLLYETENRLWDVVAAEMGDRWLQRQRAALGIGVSFRESCWAATDLFALVAEQVIEVLNPQQRLVVEAALRPRLR